MQTTGGWDSMTPFLFLAVRWPTLLRRWFRSEAGVHFRQDVKNLQRFRKTIHRFVGAPAVHRKQDESLAVMDNHRETFDLCRKSCGLKMKTSILRWTERHSAPPVFPPQLLLQALQVSIVTTFLCFQFFYLSDCHLRKSDQWRCC